MPARLIEPGLAALMAQYEGVWFRERMRQVADETRARMYAAVSDLRNAGVWDEPDLDGGRSRAAHSLETLARRWDDA